MIPGLVISVAAFLLGVAILLSVVVASVSRLSRVTLRAMAERNRAPRYQLLEQAAQDRSQFLFPLEVVIQALAGVVIALLTWLFIQLDLIQPLLLSLLTALIVPAFLLQLMPRLMTQTQAEFYVLKLLPLVSALYRLLYWLTAPLWLFLRRGRQRQEAESELNGASDEATEEEIQAYLGVGEEDGIFEEESTNLIQSALEFGSTLVREIMTPRSEIVAIKRNATVSELLELIADSKHSRIPVYGARKEEIVGVVYVRNFLVYLQRAKPADPITPVVKKPWFIPESKKVSDLLPEMQQKSEHLAIVVSEYGAVSGLITIEDLLEEIVGEIYDEDEAQEIGLEAEEDGSFVVPGGFEISDLEDSLKVALNAGDVTTVSGLVVDYLGSVPSAGQRVTIGDWIFEILESTRTRIKRLRMIPSNGGSEGMPVTEVQSKTG